MKKKKRKEKTSHVPSAPLGCTNAPQGAVPPPLRNPALEPNFNRKS